MKLRNKLNNEEDDRNKRGEKRHPQKDKLPEIPIAIHEPSEKRSASLAQNIQYY